MRNMAFIESQVNITKDGFNIQTDLNAFKSYYKPLGWKIQGRAEALPGFKEVPSRYAPVITDAMVESVNTVAQPRLF
jgi:hypothetical protein